MTQPTILVVDDEKGFLKICQVILTRAGYQVVTANTAEEALAKLPHVLPDALLLDDNMPGMSGSELAHHLSRSTRYAELPIVMFSANERTQNSGWLKKIGAKSAVRKPCMPADILEALAQALPGAASV